MPSGMFHGGGEGALYALSLSPALQVLYSTHLFSTSRVTRCPCGVRASELREALHARPAVPAPVTWDAALSKTTPRIRGTIAHVFCVSILNVMVRDRRLYGTSQRARALGKIGFAGCWRRSGWVLDSIKSAEDAGARGRRLRVGEAVRSCANGTAEWLQEHAPRSLMTGKCHGQWGNI